ncbi:MAG TPA: ThiF family adenylyltransferase [Oscillospiraceae bacterium]|nr:ThiF family adenylyltransferase [Oscillospiraceae bacterium]
MEHNFERFIKNIDVISQKEQELLFDKSVLIAGCGGLGGFIGEYLTRLGIGSLTFCDFDSFENTNMNRQLLCTEQTLEKSKAHEAKNRSLLINPNINVKVLGSKLTYENTQDILSQVDLVIDALDNAKDRIMLEKFASNKNIPLISAAVTGLSGQVAVSFPGDMTVFKLFDGYDKEEKQSTLSFAAGVIAGFAANEALKTLLKKHCTGKRVIFINLEDNTVETVQIK